MASGFGRAGILNVYDGSNSRVLSTTRQSSEGGKLLIEQLELAIEDLEETQGEEETRAEIAAPSAKEKRVRSPRGPRKLPDNLPVERVVEPAPRA